MSPNGLSRDRLVINGNSRYVTPKGACRLYDVQEARRVEDECAEQVKKLLRHLQRKEGEVRLIQRLD